MDLIWHWEFLAALFRTIQAKSLLELGVAGSQLQAQIQAPRYVGIDWKPNRAPGVRQMSTDEFFAENEESFDLILIDADHRYEQARKDLENAMRFVMASGVIACHDTMPAVREHLDARYCADSYRLLETDFPGWERLTIHRPPGLTMYGRDPLAVLRGRFSW